MPQMSQLSPDLARGVLQPARALTAAARNWVLYAPENPTIERSVLQLRDAIHQSSPGSIFALAITPSMLLIEGVPRRRRGSLRGNGGAARSTRSVSSVTKAAYGRRSARSAAARFSDEGNCGVLDHPFRLQGKIVFDARDDKFEEPGW